MSIVSWARFKNHPGSPALDESLRVFPEMLVKMKEGRGILNMGSSYQWRGVLDWIQRNGGESQLSPRVPFPPQHGLPGWEVLPSHSCPGELIQSKSSFKVAFVGVRHTGEKMNTLPLAQWRKAGSFGLDCSSFLSPVGRQWLSLDSDHQQV